MAVDLDLCFKVVSEAVVEAAKIVVEGHENKAKDVALKKGFYDLVTVYDKKTEELLIGKLSKAFPDHKFVGEETSSSNKITDDPTWIIDPIDGTSNYVNGYPQIGISLALAVKKELMIGIVCNPLLNQTFTAIKGRGAFLNGKQIFASKNTDTKKALIGLEMTLGRHPMLEDIYCQKYRNVLSKCLGIRCIGSAQVSLCMVAMGVWGGFHVTHLKSWDFAAGSIIVTEAGGCMLGVKGEKFDYESGSGIAAGTEELGRELVKCFNV